MSQPRWTPEARALESELWEHVRREFVLRSEIPEVLYHYTSAKSASKILCSRKLWLVHHEHFKDQLDTKHARDVVRRVCNSLLVTSTSKRAELLSAFKGVYPNNEPGAGPVFVACFSDTPTVPYLWQHYADAGRGYCIGIPTADTDDPAAVGLATIARPVSYDATYEEQWLRDIFSWILDRPIPDAGSAGVVLNYLGMVAAYCGVGYKDRDFAEEREWRVVAWPQPHLKDEGARIVAKPKPHLEWAVDHGRLINMASLHVGTRAQGGTEAATALLKKLGYGSSGSPPMPQVCVSVGS